MLVSKDLIFHTRSQDLEPYRRWPGSAEEFELPARALTASAIDDLRRAAAQIGDKRTLRTLDAIEAAEQSETQLRIPNFNAFLPMLRAHLRRDASDCWIYIKGADDWFYPELVCDIRLVKNDLHARGSAPSHSVMIYTRYIGIDPDRGARGSRRYTIVNSVHTFWPGDVTNKTIADALAAKGVYKECEALRHDYLGAMKQFDRLMSHGLGRQARINGKSLYAISTNQFGRGDEFRGRRSIIDADLSDVPTGPHEHESTIADEDQPVRLIPTRPTIPVFDLSTHETLMVNALALQEHEYDRSLGDKLILPASHRDLLDVLTTDLDAFVEDVIEGKSAGNVILCKGEAGMGKTLTAEIYAEMISRPLYAIHSGSLGTTASHIEKALRDIFERSRRWGCVLLLDEADVFVSRRGGDLEKNAIVAEFLRTLEYFNGLMFMTTNRPDDIDEAIISRCAAVIHYHAPTPCDAGRIWQTLATNHGISLEPALVDRLVTTFPRIAPRDIKHLLRLALRMNQQRGTALDIDLFRQCAMFRAIDIQVS